MSKSPWRALVAACLIVAAAGASAQNATLEAERRAAGEAAQKTQVLGPADVPLGQQAVLKLPTGFVFVPAPAAAQLLRSMGNPAGDNLMGLVVPASEDHWMAVIRFVAEGYVKDDDAKEWNADDLLKGLKEGTEAGNAERAKRGIPEFEVVGWAEKPRYDAGAHKLVWAASARNKGTTDAKDLGVNYNTYSLGRDGYISLNLVTDLAQLDHHRPAAHALLAGLQYNDGRKYSDFNQSTDKVAAYGLAALVGGAAAKKLGLFAVLLAFFAKFAKVIVVAGGAAAWGLFKLFGGRKEEPVRVEPKLASGDTRPAQP